VARGVAIAVGLAVAMVAVASFGIVRTRPRTQALLPPGDALARVAHTAVAGASLAQAIQGLQARVRAVPGDWLSLAGLGQAYVQQGRLTADPGFYPRAEGVLRRSLELEGRGNADAMTGMAALAAARHDFIGALAWGRRAAAVRPLDANVHAVTGDALSELGRYEEAFAEFQRGIDLRPDLSTYARASYAWELQGNLPNAVRAMRLALQAGATAADRAWAANQVGELEWGRGNLARAGELFRLALQVDPSFLPAHAGLAKVAHARGADSEAVREYTWLVERYPLPEYVIALGDLYAVQGDRRLAARQYTLVQAEERLLQANAVNVDLEIALFDADHRVEVAEGIARARAEWNRRTSIQVADALAWTLYAGGRYREALGYANRALELGTRSAPFLFHRAMIERALGRPAAARRDLARALRINPRFSILWSEKAAALLDRMEARP
jgi:tetratricopeptide (TPR) repeat protein